MNQRAELPAHLPEREPSSIRAGLPRFIASMGGVGFFRPAPGTWGSALVLPMGWAGSEACLILAALLAALGWWALLRLPEARQDPSWVVVDEGAGQSLALAALPAGGIVGVALAFLLFRAFDVLKPGPVGWADRRKGATGVMLDDIIAGTLAAALLLAARWMGVML
ncbi:phosphatidylglycerophosphatase A [Acetobacteraceae bacterium AT-5844]|nr:phosphatidylglycerophosphatase A [Acetobacteraceae bacterium AT-5844]